MEGPREGAPPRATVLVGPAVLVAIATALCAPWLLDRAPDFAERDAAFSAVALAHVQGALLTLGDWAAAPLAWPFPHGTTRADWMAGPAVLLVPARLLGVDPSRMYELAAFLGLVLTAWAGWLLARRLVGPGVPAVLAGLVAGLGPLQLGHVAHVNLVHHEWALLAPLLLWIGIREARPLPAAAGGLAAGLAWHLGLYMGLHTGLTVGLTVVALAWARPAGAGRAWAAAGAGLLAALATVAPVAAVYAAAATEGGVPEGEAASGSWDLGATFALSAGSKLHAAIATASPVRLITALESPNPGFLVAALALIGLVTRGRPRGAWLVVLAVGGVAAALALGPTPRVNGGPLPLAGPHALLDALTDHNLRDPIRWLVLAHAAVGLYAAAGLAAVVGRLPGRVGAVVSVAVLAVAALELPPRPGRGSPPPSDAYCLLDATPEEGPLFEVLGQRCGCDGATRLRATLFHGRPVVGGNYARYTPPLSAVNQLLNGWPGAGAATFLRATQARVVLEHPPLHGAPPPGAECRVADGHRVCVLPDRAAVPAPSAVTVDGGGPIVGLRWAEAPRARSVAVTCGDTVEQHPVDAWQVLATVRGVPTLDVFLESPCEGPWSVSSGAPTALYLDPTRAADTWLPALPERGPGMGAFVPGGCD